MTGPRLRPARRPRYLLVTRGGPEGVTAARWLRGADPAASVTVLCLVPSPVLAWWSEDALDVELAETLHERRVERALDEVRAALALPEPRVRMMARSGRLMREIRAELGRDTYAAVVVGQAPGRFGQRVGRLDVPLIVVPHIAAGRLVPLRPQSARSPGH